MAVRDNNYIHVGPNFRWQLCYIINGDCWYYTFGGSEGGSEGSSNGYYAYAYCAWNGGTYPSGECETDWHD